MELPRLVEVFLTFYQYLMDYKQKIRSLERMTIAKKIIDRQSFQAIKKTKSNNYQLLPNHEVQVQRAAELDTKLEKGTDALYPVYNLKKEIPIISVRDFVNQTLEHRNSLIPFTSTSRHQLLTNSRSTKGFKSEPDETNADMKTTLFKTQFDRICQSTKRHLKRIGLSVRESSSPLPPVTQVRLPPPKPKSRKRKMTNYSINSSSQTDFIMNQCFQLQNKLGRMKYLFNKTMRYKDSSLDKMDRNLTEVKTNNFLKNELVLI